MKNPRSVRPLSNLPAVTALFGSALLAAGSLLLPVSPAFAQAPITATPGPDGKSKLSEAEGQYLRSLAKSNLTELAIGFLAIEKGASDAVKKHADEMIENHVKSMKQLLELASRHDLFVPLEVDSDMVQELTLQSGATFDPAYAAAAQKINQEAINDLNGVLSQITDDKVKSFAKDDLDDDKKHLKDAQDLAAKLEKK